MRFDDPTFEILSSKEWLLSNGMGAYASSSICGANTRRYHGLLVASMNPPTQRQVIVSSIGESIFERRDTNIELSSNQYPGVIHPQGFKYIKEFERSPFPKTTFQIGDQILTKTIFMPYGSNTTIVEYENIGKVNCQLKLTPFFVDRDYHSLFKENERFNYFIDRQDNFLKLYPFYGSEPIYFKFSNGQFNENRFWHKNVIYKKEAYRGLDSEEDRIAIGSVEHYLLPGKKIHLTFTLDPEMLEHQVSKLKKAELKRINLLTKDTTINDPFLNDLKIAGDQFLVKRSSTNSHTILAGYHWFTDWGRDTMIAMRGLTIATGKKEISRSILNTFFNYLSEGMLPNRFPDSPKDEVEYNTVDATLWLFIALYEYYEKFDDLKFIKNNFDALTQILEWHFKGTRYNIHLTEEGFIYAGEGISQLTWMDARVGDHVVTPRHGCPVEIQALWYNALNIYMYFQEQMKVKKLSHTTSKVKLVTQKLKKNFKTYFLNDEAFLNDVVIPNKMVDNSIRPNQIYVLSLPFSLLSQREEKKVFNHLHKHLFTPYGLRTLNEEHVDFKPIYKGDQWHRDTAYHQGTVWPFLLGDYYLTALKLNRNSKKIKKEIRGHISKLESHFYKDDCIHGISEIFDGKEPNAGRGTINQAWSISALLLVFIKGDILG